MRLTSTRQVTRAHPGLRRWEAGWKIDRRDWWVGVYFEEQDRDEGGNFDVRRIFICPLPCVVLEIILRRCA